MFRKSPKTEPRLDNPPIISVANAMVAETAGNATVVFTRTGGTGACSVRFSTTSLGAKAGVDFTAQSRVLVSFAANENSVSRLVPIFTNPSSQESRGFYVSIAEAVSCEINQAQHRATVTITNLIVPVSVSSPTVAEGATMTFVVALSGATTTSTVYSFTQTGTATAGTDFTATPTFTNGVTLNAGNITVPASVSGFNVVYAGLQDATSEPAETIIVTIGGVQGTGTITDDDTPTLTIGTPTTGKVGTITTVSFTTSAAARGAVEFSSVPFASWDYASNVTSVSELYNNANLAIATNHAIALEANASVNLSPHLLQVGTTYYCRAAAVVNAGDAVAYSTVITFVA